MEHKPFGSNTSEAPPESLDRTDKKDTKSKKKSLSPEHVTPQKQAAEERIAKSIDGLALFERPKSDDKAEKKDTPTEDEGEVRAPLEELNEDEEVPYVTQEVAQEHLENIATTDTETQEQLRYAREFLELVADGQETEAAAAAVAAEHGIDPVELNELEESDVPESDEIEPETDLETSEAEATEINDDDEIDLRSPVPPPARTGGAGGSGTPPPPPTASGNASVPPTPSQAPRSSTGNTVVANLLNANSLPPGAMSYYEARRRASGAFLVGGILGYLLGRRRGRIKTEKRLLPVQEKLEKQVTAISQRLETKERQLTRLQARHEQQATALRTAGVRAERMQPSRVETRLAVQKPVRAERLGHMIVAAEAPAKIIEKTRLERPGNIREAFRAEEVKTMNRHQMLELSEKIKIEGASLRHIYESNLIGERQLRHLVSEYLQGHDIRDELRRHMVEHEIDFERDPIMRDRIREKLKSSAGSAAGLSQLLADAGLTSDQIDPNLQRQIEKAELKRQADMHKQHKQRLAADVAMATALVVMALAVIVLALGR